MKSIRGIPVRVRMLDRHESKVRSARRPRSGPNARFSAAPNDDGDTQLDAFIATLVTAVSASTCATVSIAFTTASH